MSNSVDYSLYLVLQTDALYPGSSFEDTLTHALQGGVTVVQLREKTASTSCFLELARSAKTICAAANVPLIINDRLDVALAVDADGLHVGQDDMPIAVARELFGSTKIIGVSCNTPEEAKQAVKAGADYLGIGPCYETNSKKDAKNSIGPRGAASILEAISDSAVPTVVIGGVNMSNVHRVLYGCTSTSVKSISGVAVVSAIASAEDPSAAAESLSKAVALHRRQSSQYRESRTENELKTAISNLFKQVRSQGGLIQNVTNTVVQNDCANVVLAMGCSPIMSSEEREAAELSQAINSLVINLGTLTTEQIAGMMATSKAANQNCKPIIFDPVGLAASSLRKETTNQLLNHGQMSIIKGNAGEMAYLAGVTGATSRGVDSSGALKDPHEVVKQVAKKERCIAIITGQIDWISDGHSVIKLSNGHPLMGQITGSGCMTGSMLGCFTAAASTLAEEDQSPLAKGDMLAAAVAAVATFSIAGEIAAKASGENRPGSFRSALIDAIAGITAQDVLEGLKIEIIT